MDEFSSIVANLASNEPLQNMASIKNAVIERIKETDAGVAIESTEYFNHTFAPDLVLRWPTDRSTRHVYLRTSTNLNYLREDIAVVSGVGPIFMPLLPLVPGNGGEDLDREASESNTLVADPPTVVAFGSASRERSIRNLVSRAVLQGGRGYVTKQRARATSHTIGLGFVGAQKANSYITRRAIDVAAVLMDIHRADQLTRLLHAIWLGSGAPASDFPGTTAITAILDASALRLLLDIAITEDSEFWRRIGANLTLERLCEADVPATSDGLQQLILANLDRLRARSCQIVSHRDEEHGYPTHRWLVKAGCLTMSTERYSAHFLPGSVSAIAADRVGEEDYITLRELVSRANEGNIGISEVTLEVTGGRQLDYKSSNDANIVSDNMLQELGGVLGSDAIVRAAVVPLGSGARQLRCDYSKNFAAGRAGAKFHIFELLGTAIPLLRALLPSERNFINGIVEPFDGAL
ncbi:hypothetical protein MTP10_13590 [Nonomuraea sp. 3-1Str]|uniref:hypothetical protein n=1 Tax=Nonomuraea sp. 3-1Str TaxID=2929801 RepID=UPI00285F6B0E|nr:hypothetical protein [Nonomuraea sp. 3-1Str]MDR8409769.1 hypothetical protein [Nonomuraea sp. 3-1Str]